MLFNFIVVFLVHAVCGFSDDDFQQMTNRMVAMETQIATLTERDAMRQKLMEDQMETILELQQHQKQQQAKVFRLESVVSLLQRKLNKQDQPMTEKGPDIPPHGNNAKDINHIKDFKESSQDQYAEGFAITKGPIILQKTSDKVSRRFVADDAVAFMAQKIGVTSNIGINQNIHFEKVHLNLGGGFHEQHGIFIAPQPGIYMFSVTLLTSHSASGIELHAELVQNGNGLARIYGHGDSGRHDQGGNTVIIQVQVDDEIWVRNVDAIGAVYGSTYSTFCRVFVAGDVNLKRF